MAKATYKEKVYLGLMVSEESSHSHTVRGDDSRQA